MFSQTHCDSALLKPRVKNIWVSLCGVQLSIFSDITEKWYTHTERDLIVLETCGLLTVIA